MKKYFFGAFIIILGAVTFGQSFSPKASDKDGKYREVKSDDGDTLAINVWDISKTPFSLSSTSFTNGSFSYASEVDTLSDVSDTLLFNFGKQFTTQKFKVYSASGDTLVLQIYSDGLSKWGSAGTGVYKSWNGSIVASNLIVIPAATTAVFYINDTHVGNIRFLWYYGLDKTGRKLPIEFIGENK